MTPPTTLAEPPGGTAIGPSTGSRSGTRPLPAWPVLLPLVTYPVWWLLGVGELVLALCAFPAALVLAHRGGVRLPKGFGIWLLFLLLVVLSLSQVDQFGRLIGAGYRVVLYVAVTTLFVYVYNAREGLPLRRLCGGLAIFLAIMTAGAVAGLLFPLWQFTTPLALVLPDGLLANDLVREMAYRRLTQFDPTAYNADQVSPRPSAPFLYTNAWGNAYSLVLPFVVLYLTRVRKGWRFWSVALLLVVSVVPAALTLNRGMFLGLALGGAYCLVRALFAGRGKAVVALVAAGAIGAGIVSLLPVEDRIETRNENVASEEVRASLYEETVIRTLDAPLLGHGAPRPSETAGSPSVGTQGQFWANLFSHGFPAALLVLVWLLFLSIRAWREFTALHVACGAVVAMAALEIFYYGFLPFGYLFVMLAGALVLRPSDAAHPAVGRAGP